MNFKILKTKFVNVIKVISTILMVSAIGWELGNIYLTLTDRQIPSSLNPIFWVERLALVIHFIEGIIAAQLAPSRGKKPIPYGVYTFFVGTVGCLELLEQRKEMQPQALGK